MVRRAMPFGNLFSLPLAPTRPVHFWQEVPDTDIVAVRTPFPTADLAIALNFARQTPSVVDWDSVSIRTSSFALALLNQGAVHIRPIEKNFFEPTSRPTAPDQQLPGVRRRYAAVGRSWYAAEAP